MALTNDLLNAMAEPVGNDAVLLSLHDDDPGATGVNELTGGSYTRQSIAWGAASGGSIQTSAPVDFSVPGGSTVAWVGLWDTAGTTFLGGIVLESSEVFAGDGTYTVTSVTVTLSNA